MRGSMTYHDLMYKISTDDIEIFTRIIKDNIEATKESKLPLI